RPTMTIVPTSRMTIPATRRWPAPSAIRIPISPRRRATLYDTTPYRPSMASKSARPPNSADSTASSCSCFIESAICVEGDERFRRSWLDLGERRFDRRLDRRGAARGTHFHVRARRQRGVLRHREVDDRLRLFADGLVFRVPDETEDLDALALAVPLPNAKLAAEHVARLEELERHGFTDDRDTLRCRPIRLAEIAAGENRRANGREISVAHRIHPRHGVVGRLGRIARHDQLVVPGRAANRRHFRETRRGDAGNRAQAR